MRSSAQKIADGATMACPSTGRYVCLPAGDHACCGPAEAGIAWRQPVVFWNGQLPGAGASIRCEPAGGTLR